MLLQHSIEVSIVYTCNTFLAELHCISLHYKMIARHSPSELSQPKLFVRSVVSTARFLLV